MSRRRNSVEGAETVPAGSVYLRRSKKLFNVYRPEPVMSIEDIAYGLSNVKRYGGQSDITVAEHSVIGARSIMRYARSVIPDSQYKKSDNAIWLRIAKRFMLHDADEALGLPDMMRQIKPDFPYYVILQNRIADVVNQRFDIQGPDSEASIVKMFDQTCARLEIKEHLDGFGRGVCADERRCDYFEPFHYWSSVAAERQYLRTWNHILRELKEDGRKYSLHSA